MSKVYREAEEIARTGNLNCMNGQTVYNLWHRGTKRSISRGPGQAWQEFTKVLTLDKCNLFIIRGLRSIDQKAKFLEAICQEPLKDYVTMVVLGGVRSTYAFIECRGTAKSKPDEQVWPYQIVNMLRTHGRVGRNAVIALQYPWKHEEGVMNYCRRNLPAWRDGCDTQLEPTFQDSVVIEYIKRVINGVVYGDDGHFQLI